MKWLAVVIAIADMETHVFVPVAGNWRGTTSTLTLVNRSTQSVSAEISFRGGASETLRISLAPSETKLIDVARDVLRGKEAVGALEVRANGPLEASVMLVDSQQRGGVFTAIPVRDAIGSGESTHIALPPAAENSSRLFVAETRGFPLYLSATVTQDGRRVGQRRYYVAGYGQSTHTLDSDFALDRTKPFTLELHGINGSGRIIAAGASVAPDRTIRELTMTRRSGVRHELSLAEASAYVLAALAVLILYTRKRRVSSAADVERPGPIR